MRASAILPRIFLTLACAAALYAHADDIDVIDARLAASEEGLLLSADFGFEFNARLGERGQWVPCTSSSSSN